MGAQTWFLRNNPKQQTMAGIARLLRTLAAAIVVAFVATAALAQLPTGNILGVVKDSSGGVVSGASVTVRNVDTGSSRTSATGDDGSYRFSALAVGNYDIGVSHDGFQTASRKGLNLSVAQEAVIDFTMQVGSSTQTVVVTEEAPVINTTSGSISGLVSEQKMSDLPLNGRNYVDLSLLQPGITQQKNFQLAAGASGTWFSSNGAPPRSNNYLLDGAPLVNFYGATASSVTGSSLGVDGIREYKVVTNSFSAEYGVTMGSQMVIVSKSGANRFSGDVFEYLRNSSLDARNFFDSNRAYPGKRLPPYQRNNFGGAFGGPIRKDKTFFYGVYEGLRENLGTTNTTSVIPSNCFDPATHLILLVNNPCATLSPTGTVAPGVQALARLYPFPNAGKNLFTFPFIQRTTDNYGQMRVDQNISASDTFFVRYTIEDSSQLKPRPYQYFKDTWRSRNQFATVSENHIFGPSLLNTARVSYSRTNLDTSTADSPALQGLSFVPGQPFGQISIGGTSTLGGDVSNPAFHIQNIYTGSDDVYWSRGKHALKFGMLFNRFQQASLDSNGRAASTSSASVAAFLAGLSNQTKALLPGANNENRHFVSSTFGV